MNNMQKLISICTIKNMVQPTFNYETFERYRNEEEFRIIIDRMFSKVEPFIDEFARLHSLTVRKWYNSAPTWFLRWHDKDAIRLVYIVAGQYRKVPNLSVSAYAYTDDLTRRTRYGLQRAIVLESPIPEDKILTEPDVVTNFLVEAFAKANDISNKDFIELGALSK